MEEARSRASSRIKSKTLEMAVMSGMAMSAPSPCTVRSMGGTEERTLGLSAILNWLTNAWAFISTASMSKKRRRASLPKATTFIVATSRRMAVRFFSVAWLARSPGLKGKTRAFTGETPLLIAKQ